MTHAPSANWLTVPTLHSRPGSRWLPRSNLRGCRRYPRRTDTVRLVVEAVEDPSCHDVRLSPCDYEAWNAWSSPKPFDQRDDARCDLLHRAALLKVLKQALIATCGEIVREVVKDMLMKRLCRTSRASHRDDRQVLA